MLCCAVLFPAFLRQVPGAASHRYTRADFVTPRRRARPMDGLGAAGEGWVHMRTDMGLTEGQPARPLFTHWCGPERKKEREREREREEPSRNHQRGIFLYAEFSLPMLAQVHFFFVCRLRHRPLPEAPGARLRSLRRARVLRRREHPPAPRPRRRPPPQTRHHQRHTRPQPRRKRRRGRGCRGRKRRRLRRVVVDARAARRAAVHQRPGRL